MMQTSSSLKFVILLSPSDKDMGYVLFGLSNLLKIDKGIKFLKWGFVTLHYWMTIIVPTTLVTSLQTSRHCRYPRYFLFVKESNK